MVSELWPHHDAGTAGNRLLGPSCLAPRLTGAAYSDILHDALPELLQVADLQARSQLWFMHDGAPPHFLLAFREFLNNLFPERWMGRGGPTAWSAPSSDLNPLHFYLW